MVGGYSSIRNISGSLCPTKGQGEEDTKNFSKANGREDGINEYFGSAIAQAVFGLSPRSPRFGPRAVQVWSLVDKVALGQGFSLGISSFLPATYHFPDASFLSSVACGFVPKREHTAYLAD
jgi:hypothetical protein